MYLCLFSVFIRRNWSGNDSDYDADDNTDGELACLYCLFLTSLEELIVWAELQLGGQYVIDS